MSGCVSVSNLSIQRGRKELYRDFSISFACGEVTAVFGSSGCGKTTLLDCIAGLLKPQSGIFSCDCEDNKLVSYLFQEPRLLPWRTLLQNITLPLENLMEIREAEDRACRFLDKTGLLSRKNDFPAQLSGGERQRAAIARAFAFPAPVLLMDEAFQSQDVGRKTRLMELFRSLLETEPRTVIMVSHDIYDALYLADRVVVLAGLPARIVLDERKENTSEGLSHLENTIINVLTAEAVKKGM